MDIKVQSFSLSTKWLKFVLKLGFGNMSKVSNNSISANCAFCSLKNRPFSSLWTNLWTFDCSLWSVIFLFLLCVYCTLLASPPAPTPPPNFAYTIVFKSSWEDCIFPKGYENNSLCKICGVNRVHYGGFESSQWEGGACAPVAPLPHYSPLRSHGIFLAAYRWQLWSRKYLLHACIRKTALWLKGYISFDCLILLFCRICFLYLTVGTKR